MTAAAQICHRVALTCQLRFEERNQHKKLKKIASVLSNAILEFWSSVEVPGELEETSLGIVKVLDCQTSFLVLDDNGDHKVLSFSFKSELCIYIYICMYIYICIYMYIYTHWIKVLTTLTSWNHIIMFVTRL